LGTGASFLAYGESRIREDRKGVYQNHRKGAGGPPCGDARFSKYGGLSDVYRAKRTRIKGRK